MRAATEAPKTTRAIQWVNALSNVNRDGQYAALIALAQLMWEREQTQMAADALAFVLLQDDLSLELRELADGRFAEMESRVCPRIILDARQFAAEMDLQSTIEYVLEDGISSLHEVAAFWSLGHNSLPLH